MNKLLYKFRGWILGLFALGLLIVPGAPLKPSILPAAFSTFLLITLSAFMRVQARRSIGEHTRGYTHAADSLVTTGIYSRLRHPLYVSNTGIAVSAIWWHFGINIVGDYSPEQNTSYVIAAAFALGIAAFEILLSRMEDHFLEGKFGDQWRSWASGTPAFFPSLRPTSSQDAFQRSFSAAFIADRSSWFWILFYFTLLTLRKLI